jgi:hypothetical protein
MSESPEKRAVRAPLVSYGDRSEFPKGGNLVESESTVSSLTAGFALPTEDHGEGIFSDEQSCGEIVAAHYPLRCGRRFERVSQR